MPIYRIRFAEGLSEDEPLEVSLPDKETAYFEAIRMMGELLRDYPDRFVADGEWRAAVSDDQDRPIFTVLTRVNGPSSQSSVTG